MDVKLRYVYCRIGRNDVILKSVYVFIVLEVVVIVEQSRNDVILEVVEIGKQERNDMKLETHTHSLTYPHTKTHSSDQYTNISTHSYICKPYHHTHIYASPSPPLPPLTGANALTRPWESFKCTPLDFCSRVTVQSSTTSPVERSWKGRLGVKWGDTRWGS